MTQEDSKGVARAIRFHSRSFSRAERGYGAVDRELLGLVSACKVLRHYLLPRRFTLITDHKPLLYLFGSKSAGREHAGRRGRWRIDLMEFQFDLVHRAGCRMLSDALSRLPMTHDEVEDAKRQLRALHEVPANEEAAPAFYSPIVLAGSPEDMQEQEDGGAKQASAPVRLVAAPAAHAVQWEGHTSAAAAVPEAVPVVVLSVHATGAV